MLGYFSMGRADDMSYIGEYFQISKSGSIGWWDIYPGSLIFGATLSILSGLPANFVSFVIPIVFSFIFIGGLYLCCRFFLREEILLSIAIIVSFIFYLGPYNFLNVPHALFFAYMPLFIFILCRYIQNKKLENIFLIIFPILLIPYTHPFIVFFVFSLLFILILFNRILKKIIPAEYGNVKNLLLVVIVGFLGWFLYTSFLLSNFKSRYNLFISGTSEPVFLKTTEKLSHINADFMTIIKLLFLYYARYFIPLIIIIIALSFLFSNVKGSPNS